MIITEQNAFVGLLWPANATMEEMQEIVRRMDNDMRELRDKHNSSTAEVAKYRNQVGQWETWALSVVETADEEADERGWCDTYDSIRDRLTSAVPTPVEFPLYGERDYLVTWNEEIVFTVSRSTVVTAKSPEDAIEVASQDDMGVEFDEIRDAYQCSNYETSSSDDWEAEEA